MPCERQTDRRFLERPTPPYIAGDCVGKKLKGNNHQWYITQRLKNGTYRWQKDNTKRTDEDDNRNNHVEGGLTAEVSSVKFSYLQTLTLAELKALATSKKYSSNGTKSELVQRINSYENLTLQDVIYDIRPRGMNKAAGVKVAAFDLDDTLVKNTRLKDKTANWNYLFDSVPHVLRDLYEDGYKLYIFTNQSNIDKLPLIEEIAKALHVPIRVAIGLKGFTPQKPQPELAKLAGFFDIRCDRADSFYVGNSAGLANDYADTDLMFARALGIPFMIPEQIFRKKQKISSTSSMGSVKASKPNPSDRSHILPHPPKKVSKQHQEVIVMVGYPCSGKSTYVSENFSDCEVLSGDVLKTPARILSKLKQALKSNKSVVIDATNPTMRNRAEYIQAARSHGNVVIRCVYYSSVSVEEAKSRCRLRELETGKKVPNVALYVFRNRLEIPSTSEGFDEVVEI